MLCQNIRNNPALNISQAETASLELVGQFLVIDTQQMENGGLQIMNMHWILSDVIA